MDNKYEIVNTILRAAGAEKYLNKFKEHRIDLSCLKLLSDEDLTFIGIDDIETRKNILRNCCNLQMRLEERTNLTVDKTYVLLVLNQIANHLPLHHANLACALLRNDISIYNVKLQHACISLSNCLESLDNEVYLLQQKLNPAIVTKKRKKIIALSLLTIALLGFTLKVIAK